MADKLDTSRWWFNCVCVSECVYLRTCRHIARRMMQLCMYVGYHSANNVSNFGGDPVTQLNFKNLYSIIYAVLRTWHSIAVMQSQFLRRLLRDHAQTAAVWKTIADNTIKWPYQPKHSPSSPMLPCLFCLFQPHLCHVSLTIIFPPYV